MSNAKRAVIWTLLIIAFVLLLAPYVYTVSFTIPSSDDFSIGYVAKLSPETGLFAKAVDISNSTYMTWGGSWTGSFLQIVLNPLNLFTDYLKYIGLEMVLFFVLFVAAFSLLINTVVRYVFSCNDALLRTAIIFFSLMAVLLSDVFFHIFYWFTGSVYSWYLCFSMLLVSLMIKDMYGHGSTGNSVAMFLLGVLACQNMCMDITTGIFAVFVVFWGLRNQYPHTKMIIALLALMIVSGCSVVFAPGNYVRYGGKAESINFIWSIKHSILECVDELKFLASNSSLYVVFAVIFLLGTRVDTNWSLKTVAILFALAGISVYGIILPVDIGYSGTYIPNRIRFLFDAVLIAYLTVILLILGAKSGNWLQKNRWVCWGFMLAATVLLTVGGGYKNNAYYRTVTHADEARIESDAYKMILRSIETSEENDVVILIDSSKIPASGIIELPNISGNTWDSVNHAAAGFYGKNTLKFEWE